MLLLLKYVNINSITMSRFGAIGPRTDPSPGGSAPGSVRPGFLEHIKI